MNGNHGEADVLTREIRDNVDSVLSLDSGSEGPGEPLVKAFSNRLEHLLDRRVSLPTRVGPFNLSTVLGFGGMGVVMEGEHRTTGQRAAVKLALRSKPQFAEILRREARALARIDALNVVKILDSGETDDYVWMAMNRVDGKTLAALARPPETDSDVHVSLESSSADSNVHTEPNSRTHAGLQGRLETHVAWFRDTARALHQMHLCDLIHRDVKPANIIINNEDRPVLIDFGLAHDAGEACHALAGTIPFLSPEQTRLDWEVLEPPSDVYNLAMTFHEVLTGTRTITTKGNQALRDINYKSTPAPSRVAKHLPSSLDPIFARALAKDVDARYASAEALADDLDTWLTRRSQRSLRLALTMLSIAVVVVALSLGVWALLPDQLLEELRANVDARRFDTALELAIRHREDRKNDEEFSDLEARAVSGVGPERTRALMFASSLSVDTHGDGGAQAPRKMFGAQARRLLSDYEDPDLLLHALFDSLMSNRVEEARRTLQKHRHLVQPSHPNALVAALVPAAAGHFEEARREFRQAQRDPRQNASHISCMKSLLLLWRADGKRLGSSTELGELEARVTAQYEKMTEVSGPLAIRENRLLLAVRSRLLFELGRYELALADYRVLFEGGRVRAGGMEPLTKSERQGLIAFQAAAGVLMAGSDETYLADAVRHASLFAGRSDGILDWIAAKGIRGGLKRDVAWKWFAGITDSSDSLRLEGRHILGLMDAVTRPVLFAGTDPIGAGKIARCASFRPAADDALNARKRSIASTAIWAGHFAASQAVEPEDFRRFAGYSAKVSERFRETGLAAGPSGTHLDVLADAVEALNEASAVGHGLVSKEAAIRSLELALERVRATGVSDVLDEFVEGYLDDELTRLKKE